VLSSEKNTGLKGKKSYGEENISIKKWKKVFLKSWIKLKYGNKEIKIL
jgi:hypothetical protein